MKTLFWINPANDPDLHKLDREWWNYRLLPLVRYLEKIVKVESINISNLPEDPNSMILYHKFGNGRRFSQKDQPSLIERLELLKKFHNIIIADTDEFVLQEDYTEEVSSKVLCVLFAVGKPKNIHVSNGFGGYGYVHIDKMPTMFIPYDIRQEVFHFEGTLNSPSRYNLFLLAKGLKTNIIICDPWQDSTNYLKKIGSFHMKLTDLCDKVIEDRSSFKTFIRNLNHYKYSLCPRGTGNTFRVLESMSQGNLVITDEFLDQEFIIDIFKDGYNYISAGPECLNFRDIKEFNPSIAHNGHMTYLNYFSNNCIIKLVVKRLNKYCNYFFT